MNSIPFPSNSLVCAYLRDSGGADQDLSVEQQEAEVRAWCESNALILSRVFYDVATPGSSVIGRQSFLDMISHFHNGCQEKGLIIWRFSRFARDFDDGQFFKADLRRRGYEIISIKDQIPDGSVGRLIEAALDWSNERFLEDLSTDVKRGQRHLVTQYGALGGFPPYGFHREIMTIGTRRDGRPHTVARWAPDTDLDIRARIQAAWKVRAEGATYADIHRCFRIFRVPKSYYRFYRNTLYKGELRFSGQSFPNYCEPLINNKLWDQVQETLRNHKSP